MTADEMDGWHHQLDGHEFEQAPGVGDGQGSLVCCSPWGHKEPDKTEWLNYFSASFPKQKYIVGVMQNWVLQLQIILKIAASYSIVLLVFRLWFKFCQILDKKVCNFSSVNVFLLDMFSDVEQLKKERWREKNKVWEKRSEEKKEEERGRENQICLKQQNGNDIFSFIFNSFFKSIFPQINSQTHWQWMNIIFPRSFLARKSFMACQKFCHSLG